MRRTTPVLSTAAVVCGLLLIAPLSASAAPLPTGADNGAGLRAAISSANGSAQTVDTIDLTAGQTYTLTGGGAGEDGNATGDLDITSPLIINGNGATISAAGLGDRIFDVLGASSLVLNNVVVTGGAAPDTENGGAVRVADGATLTVSGGSFLANTAVNETAAAAPAAPLTANSGGAISAGGDISIVGASFSGNSASRAGGAVEIEATGSATVSGGSFTGNNGGAAPGNGGAIHITGAGSAAVTGGTYTSNTAAEGGALWNSGAGTLTVTDATIANNTANGAAADQGGGGVFTEGGAVTISGGTISANRANGAAGSGGGILNVNGNVSVTGTNITGNSAERAGGGIEAGPRIATENPAVTANTAPTTTTLTGVDLSDNFFTTQDDASPRNGAGLHITGAGTVTVTDSQVTGNSGAREGGGLWNSAAGVMNVSGTDIVENTTNGVLADQGGGGVFTEGGDVLIDTSLIADNAATGAAASGGGILNITGSVAVVDSEISGNTAVRAGGGIEAGPLLAVPDATPPITGRADATETALVGVDLLDNAVTGPPGNGGGFHLTGAGNVLVDESLVQGNRAVEGGGLWNSSVGTMAVTNSTVAGNSASGTDGGGGLYQDGAGTPTGAIAGINVTITGNSAPAGQGGAFLNASTVTSGLLHATVTGNASGVAGPVEIGNTILTGNATANTDAGVTSVGGNVLAAAVPFSANRLPGADDTTGVNDPQLGALADNGGPTPTLLPRTGSPVIDAGLPVADEAMEGMDDASALLDLDQRGVARPLDGNGDGRADVDSGSVEAAAIAVTPAPGGGGVTPPARPVPAQPNYTG